MIKLIIFVLGLFIGSFLGVLIDRLPKKQNIIKGRSRCEFCKKELGLLDLIPVFSYLFLRGKCRFCGTKLSLFYPVIEVLTGTLFLLIYILLNFQFSIFNFQFLYYLFMISTFIVIFFTDLKYGIIPDKIIFPAILITFFWLTINHQSLIINHLFSAIGAFLFFIAIAYLFFLLTKKQSMGGGDIKLSILLGLFLGFPNIVVSLYIAFLTGALASIILILWKKKAFSKDTLPFGPFLIAGAVISLFWGSYIYSFAQKLLGI